MPKSSATRDDADRGAAKRTGDRTARRILLQGRVQGLGVRPAIIRLARRLGVAGAVGNSAAGVLIVVEGQSRSVQSFERRLTPSLPEGALVEMMSVYETSPTGRRGFRIEPSLLDGRPAARVPPDMAVCQKCQSEVSDRRNRRYGYVFTTCTSCGPRYSLIASMPYDRLATGMARFASCPRCDQEYGEPGDRRFHSQTNCCPHCGPQWSLETSSGEISAPGASALEPVLQAIRAGQIVALRGVGGYQLALDATNAQAVAELRRRKQRHGKPLAVMVADLAAAERLADVSRLERRSLCSSANPIVVASAKHPSPLPSGVSAGLDTIGLLLPTTPLHAHLANMVGRPLVLTSGNPEGAPLVVDTQAARQELAGIADLWIHHDRPIVRPIDDSVVRFIAGQPATIRLARGLAPLSLNLRCAQPMAALGGHQKVALALANGVQSVLGPHVGDLEDEATRIRFVDHFRSLCLLYDTQPEILVHDQHPDYFTTEWARQSRIATHAVQHHHAHVAAGMLEHGWLDRTVLGVSWDGTGYGTDGTIWGGEFLLATAIGFRRVARLHPFHLLGGEAAVRQPWRIAVALVHEALGPEATAALRFPGVAQPEPTALVGTSKTPRLALQTSSAGRLFDGIAALVLDVARVDFEGQGAMLLEAACDPAASGEYPLPFCEGEIGTLDWRPLVRQVVQDRAAKVAPGAIAMRFHRALAQGIATVAAQFSELPLVLCGGCFQNRVLTESTVERLARRGSPVGTPGVIPTGDGGLAAGQLAVATARIGAGWRPCV